ncbi:hypothetical protein M408DRAFT_23053 [Serendipita vermifera MAFF 305830]|uniref:Uncharacterized protein n=1 Tax=Serendipita vermifera MAFF 305830 TaxID=933852 RepID=A0A0C3AXK1_SERVB|nr:hypothetical protein M408DRAFT_23053 [Serendipita vermifera MAFF 305830]
MSGLPNFDFTPTFGLLHNHAEDAPPLSPNALVSLQTDNGTPDAGLITRLFRGPRIPNGDALRTLISNVLNSSWYKKKRLNQMPRGTLDPFAQRRGELTVCLFCDTPYDNAGEGLGCVKAHFGL